MRAAAPVVEIGGEIGIGIDALFGFFLKNKKLISFVFKIFQQIISINKNQSVLNPWRFRSWKLFYFEY